MSVFKQKRIRVISKTYNNFARALGIFVSLPSLHDNDVKLLNFTFLWECEHKTTIFLFFFVFLIEIQTFRTQLARNSLTFGKFSVMKQKRWSLKEHLCFYKWGFWYRRRRGCTLNLPIKTEHWTKWSLSQFPCIVCINQNSAAGLAQSVERSTAEREVAGSIWGAGSIHKVLKYWEMKVLPLPCNQVHLRVARMTT